MNTTRADTSRAKLISWVTRIIVMPSAASSRTTFKHLADQFRVERRSDLVEQQHFRIHGDRARNADALLLTA